MKLDPEFYQNLFKNLSEQIKSQGPDPRGGSRSAELTRLMKKLHEDASARHIFIIESTGKKTTSYGDLGNIDITDLIALVVGKMLACRALAEVVNGQPLLAASMEGRRWGAHFSMLDEHNILMVVFDHQTNVDLVGQRVRRASQGLATALAAEENKNIF